MKVGLNNLVSRLTWMILEGQESETSDNRVVQTSVSPFKGWLTL